MREDHASVAAQVAGLSSLSIADLWALWDRFFPRRPDNPNRRHLESRIAYKLQEEAFGGLCEATRRRLVAIGQQHSKIKTTRPPRNQLASGTVLIREWGDQDHRVTVTPQGTFEYAGQHFKTLSAVARHITGAHWSGPLFFGLYRARGAR